MSEIENNRRNPRPIEELGPFKSEGLEISCAGSEAARASQHRAARRKSKTAAKMPLPAIKRRAPRHKGGENGRQRGKRHLTISPVKLSMPRAVRDRTLRNALATMLEAIGSWTLAPIPPSINADSNPTSPVDAPRAGSRGQPAAFRPPTTSPPCTHYAACRPRYTPARTRLARSVVRRTGGPCSHHERHAPPKRRLARDVHSSSSRDTCCRASFSGSLPRSNVHAVGPVFCAAGRGQKPNART